MTDETVATDLTDRFSRPEHAARHLYEAWRGGNRVEALRSAVPDVVEALFSYPFPAGGLSAIQCENLGPEGFTCPWTGNRLSVSMGVNGGASVGYRVIAVEVRPAGQQPEAQPAFLGIWPETTQAELDRSQALVHQGHQPWRLEPVEVARAYLTSLGAVDVELFPYVSSHDRTGRVAYRAGNSHGRVHLGRMAAGGIFFVVSSDTASATVHQVVRQGTTLRVVAEHAPGTLRVATRAFGTTTWVESEVQTSDLASSATLTVQLPDAEAPALLRVHHQAPDGTAGIGERRV